MKGPFITIEGVDGAGKSSHIPTVVEQLRAAGFEVVSSREPGGTPLGEELREMILRKPMDLSTEVFLAFASRSEHLASVIRPGLEDGKAVVSDRFTDSTYAYQGGGRGFPRKAIMGLETMVHGDLQPDLTLLFDLPVEESLRRLGKTGKDPDKFEIQSADFFRNVRQAYLERQALAPDRVRVIDASQTIEQVAESVKKVVSEFIEQWRPASQPSPRRPSP